MNWPYFDLVPLPLGGDDEDDGIYKLVDEDGWDFRDEGHLVYFVSHEEADQFLRNHNIRGTVR